MAGTKEGDQSVTLTGDARFVPRPPAASRRPYREASLGKERSPPAAVPNPSTLRRAAHAPRSARRLPKPFSPSLLLPFLCSLLPCQRPRLQLAGLAAAAPRGGLRAAPTRGRGEPRGLPPGRRNPRPAPFAGSRRTDRQAPPPRPAWQNETPTQRRGRLGRSGLCQWGLHPCSPMLVVGAGGRRGGSPNSILQRREGNPRPLSGAFFPPWGPRPGDLLAL